MASARPAKKIEHQGKTLSGQLLTSIHQEFKKSKIIRLKLIDCRISAEEFHKLIPLIEQHRHWLEEVDLSGMNIGNRGAFSICNISQKSPLLHTLNLSKNKIDADNADCLEGMLRAREKPLNLNLNYNPIIGFLKKTSNVLQEYPLLYATLKLPPPKLPEIKNAFVSAETVSKKSDPLLGADTPNDPEIKLLAKTIVANTIQKALRLLDQTPEPSLKEAAPVPTTNTKDSKNAPIETTISIAETKNTASETPDPDLDSYVHDMSLFKRPLKSLKRIITSDLGDFEDLSDDLSPLTPISP